MPLTGFGTDTGVEIDPITGKPVDWLVAEAEAEMARHLKQSLDGAEILKAELASPQGLLLRNVLVESLTQRLEALMVKDEICQSIIGIAERIGVQLVVLPQMAEREIHRRLHE